MEADQTLILTLDPNAGWRVIGEALLAAVPLAGLSAILFRTGRRGAWLAAPWVLALVFAPASIVGFGGMAGMAATAPGELLTMLWLGWSQGAYASVFVTIVWLAIFGISSKRFRQAPDRTAP